MRSVSPLALLPLVLSLAVPCAAGEDAAVQRHAISRAGPGFSTRRDRTGRDAQDRGRVEGRHGVLRCSGVPNGYLRTVADHQDYVLKLEWRWVEKSGGNSGIFLRIVGEDRIWPKTIEAQLKSGDAGDLILANGATLVTDPARLDPANPRHRRQDQGRREAGGRVERVRDHGGPRPDRR